MLNFCRTLRSGTLLSVVQILLWLSVPDAFHTDLSFIILHFMHLMHIKLIILVTTTAVQLLFCWHGGHPPERPPYIPKRRRRWKRLSQQFCQLLKSWTHKISSFFTWTRTSASDRLIKLHFKLQRAILSFRNSRRLHIRKLLAFKHRPKAFSKPRVRFKKAQYVFPLLASLPSLSTRPHLKQLTMESKKRPSLTPTAWILALTTDALHAFPMSENILWVTC